MRLDKSNALKLRLEGNSYSQISVKLDIPKSTLSSWLSKLQLSEALIEKIQKGGRKKATEALIIRNRKQTSDAVKRSTEARKTAKTVLNSIDSRDIFIAGIALYWAEGYKRAKSRSGRLVTYHPISLTNSDPKLVRLFLLFLRGYCQVKEEKIRASLRLFPHQNEESLVDYWVQVTGLKKSSFGKSYVGISSASKGIRPFNQLPFGIIQIRVSDTPLFHRIMGWIEGLADLV